MDQIRDLVLSWQMREVLRLAREDDEVLSTLLGMLNDSSESLRIRVLSVLENLFHDLPVSHRKAVINRALVPVLKVMEIGDKSSFRAVSVLKRLVEGVPLTEDSVSLLLESVLNSLERNRALWSEVFELSLSVSEGYGYSKNIEAKLHDFLTNRDLAVSAVGVGFASSLGVITSSNVHLIGKVIGNLLESNDPVFVDAGVRLLGSLLTFPTPQLLEVLFEFSYSPLKKLVESEYGLLRFQAKEMLRIIQAAIVRYALSKPDDARDFVEYLRDKGLLSEADFVETNLPPSLFPSSLEFLKRIREKGLLKFIKG